jgi:spermidine/putrescine transport system ATP-binding protein
MTADATTTQDRREGVVEVVDLAKQFGQVAALDGVSFRLEPGTFFALLGPSGCGKTTLLRLIAGFEIPDRGEILINGQPVAGVPAYRRPVNTVFQHYALFPHMDVASNVGYGLRQRRPTPGRAEQARRIDEALDLVRLSGYNRRRSWELSGGQQQRVALARALINRPTVLLLDEPLGALDLKLRREMQVELKQLQEQVGITFIFVTHDQDEALSMADRVAVMRDGQVLQDGPPAHIYDRPVDPWVASFIGQMNFLPGRVEEVADTGAVRLARGPVLRGQLPEVPIGVGDEALLAVRPERIWLTQASGNGSTPGHPGTTFAGRVVRTVFMGDKVEHIVDAPALGTLVISAPNVESGAPAPAIGEEVMVGWPDDAARIIREQRPVA